MTVFLFELQPALYGVVNGQKGKYGITKRYKSVGNETEENGVKLELAVEIASSEVVLGLVRLHLSHIDDVFYLRNFLDFIVVVVDAGSSEREEDISASRNHPQREEGEGDILHT